MGRNVGWLEHAVKKHCEKEGRLERTAADVVCGDEELVEVSGGGDLGGEGVEEDERLAPATLTLLVGSSSAA